MRVTSRRILSITAPFAVLNVSGATGRVLWAGIISLSNICMFMIFRQLAQHYNLAMLCVTIRTAQALFGNRHDITARGNLIERGEGEGILYWKYLL